MFLFILQSMLTTFIGLIGLAVTFVAVVTVVVLCMSLGDCCRARKGIKLEKLFKDWK